MAEPKQLCAAVGMFDGGHLGHRSLLVHVREAANIRGQVPAVFTFDAHPLEIVAPERAPKLLSSLPERINLLHEAGAEHVEVLKFDSELRNLSAEDFMAMLRNRFNVATLVIGFNHRFGRGADGSFDEYRETGHSLGIDVLKADECAKPGISSTAVRHMLAKGDIEHANALLGRHFRMTGIVENGHHIGRTIGFPTANIRVDPRIIVPAPGVYAAKATMPDTTEYPAMVNIGVRPTVDNTPSPDITIEAHMIGFDGNLYGKEITLGFIGYLRPEQKFPTLVALRTQLASDLQSAIALHNSHPD